LLDLYLLKKYCIGQDNFVIDKSCQKIPYKITVVSQPTIIKNDKRKTPMITRKLVLFVCAIFLTTWCGCQAMDGFKKDLDSMLQKMEMKKFNPPEETASKENISSRVSKPAEKEEPKPAAPVKTVEKPGEVEYGLTINPEPISSNIKLMNIDEQYYPGIKLSPGYYEILVECKGYESYREWVKLENDKLLKIALNKTGAAKVSTINPADLAPASASAPTPVKKEQPVAKEEVIEEAPAVPQLPDLLTGHIDSVTSLSFSADGSMLASGSYDSTIIIWSMKDGTVLQKTNHGDKIRAVAFAHGGSILASGGNDKLVKLWDMKTGKLNDTLRGLTDRAYSIEFSPRGDIVAAGGNNELIMWNVGSGKIEHHLQGDVAPYPRFGTIKAISFNPQGKDADGYMCAFTCQQGVSLFNPENKGISTIRDTSMPGSIAYSPNGQYIAWGARDQHSESAFFPRFLKVSTREIDNDISRSQSSASADRVFYTTYAPGGRQIIMLSYKQAVLYDIKTGSIIRTFPGASETSVTGAALSHDGKMLAVTTGNNIRLWQME